ncbi:excisionase family DNA binding protein [Corynebacterium mucifaciens]
MNHTNQTVKARTYSVREAAAILGIGKSTLHDHVRAGTADHLHPIRLGTVTRFPKATIDALAAGAA